MMMQTIPAASPLIRAALMVRNLERSRDFYMAVVGLTQEFFVGDMAGSTAAEIIGVPRKSSIRAAILKAPGVDYGMVGLFEIDASTPAVKPRSGGVSLGEVVLVFYTENMQKALEAVALHGGNIATPLQTLNGRKEIAVRDPDGVAINLIERSVSDAYRQRAAGDPITWPPK